MSDNVNSPAHYTEHCDFQCIETIEIAFGIRMTFYFCLVNAYKYIWRNKAKNGREDLDKAEWYTQRAMNYYFDDSLCEEDKEKYRIIKKILYNKYDTGYQE